VQCGEHGVVQIAVPWPDPKSRFAALFEALVIDWLKKASFSAVARQLSLTNSILHNISVEPWMRYAGRRTENPFARETPD
jgi:transposase